MATPRRLGLEQRLRLPLDGRNLRIDEVSARIGIAQSTVDKLVIEGLFPAPVRVGTTQVWPASLLVAQGLLES